MLFCSSCDWLFSFFNTQSFRICTDAVRISPIMVDISLTPRTANEHQATKNQIASVWRRYAFLPLQPWTANDCSWERLSFLLLTPTFLSLTYDYSRYSFAMLRKAIHGDVFFVSGRLPFKQIRFNSGNSKSPIVRFFHLNSLFSQRHAKRKGL